MRDKLIGGAMLTLMVLGFIFLLGIIETLIETYA